MTVNDAEEKRPSRWETPLPYVGVILVVLSYVALHLANNTTELWPDHGNALETCFISAAIIGVAVAIATFIAMKGTSMWRRLYGSPFAGLAAAIFFALFAMEFTELIYGWHDFPRGHTQTRQALIRISRAYATHGKGSNYDIQTMPLWSDMKIEESDYKFMRAHLPPFASPSTPDETSSKGYFCARVTIQQFGDAIRVLHAGNETLPAGTVVLCPTIPDVDSPAR